MNNVLIVDDSFFARRVLRDLVNDFSDFEVVATAKNGREALEELQDRVVDVMTLDVEMPEMDGLELLQQTNQRGIELPVIMVSSRTSENARETVRALELGADEIIEKPTAKKDGSLDEIEQELHNKMSALVQHSSSVRDNPSVPENRSTPISNSSVRDKVGSLSPDVLLIGGSTGAPGVIRSIVERLPQSFGWPVVIVQHIEEPFLTAFINNLRDLTPLPVTRVDRTNLLKPGIYLPRDDAHVKFRKGQSETFLRMVQDDPVKEARPSIDVLFKSAAEVFGNDVIAVLLSGLGADGAEGLGVLQDRGALCLTQDEESSTVYGMPQKAWEKGAVDLEAPADRIPDILNGWYTNITN